MATRNLICIESIEIGAVRLLSFRAYVAFLSVTVSCPRQRLPDSRGFAIGDPRSSSPDQRPARVTAHAGSPARDGPGLLDLAAASLVRLALGPPHRQAGDGDCLASPGIPALLEVEETPRPAGRPELAKEIRALIRTMSLANRLWGAPRIHGELRKPPSPAWRTFISNHVVQLAPVPIEKREVSMVQ